MKKISVKQLPPFIYLMILFITGFTIGIFYIAFGKEGASFGKDILDLEFFSKFQNMTIDKRALVFLTLWNRLRAFFLLLFLAFSIFGVVTTSLFVLFLGFSAGSILEILALRYGLQGMGMYLMMILPQGIFYGAGYSIILIRCLHIHKERKNPVSPLEAKRWNQGKILISFLLIVLGCITESYFNLFQLFSPT